MGNTADQSTPGILSPFGLFSFSAGALIAPLAPVLPAWSWLCVGIVLAAALLYWPTLRLPALFLAGTLWFAGHAKLHLDSAWPASRAGEVVTVAGTVTGLPETRGHRTRFVFRTDLGQAETAPARILVTWYRPREYFRPGERWQLDLRLDPPHGRLNPHAFDYTRYLLARRIGSIATVRGEATLLDARQSLAAPGRVRQRLAEWLQSTTVNLDAAAVNRALTVADRSAMDAELTGTLRRTGTAHLLAISGLHVGLVAGAAALCAGFLASALMLSFQGLDRRRAAIMAGLAAAVAYALLSGFTMPTRRALAMLAVAAGAVLIRRGIQPGHALVLALATVLLIDPLAPLATGFWLSFAAVSVLVWTFAWRPGRAGWGRGLLRAQALIAMGMAPLNAGVFQQLIPAALAANLVAIPVVGFWVLPCLLMAAILFLTGLPAAWAVGWSETGLVPLLDFLGWLDGLGMGHRAVAGPGLAGIALGMFGACWLLAPRGWPVRPMGIALFLPLLWPPVDRPAHGGLEAWVLDVGNGLAVVVRTRDETLLYDTGPGDGAGVDQVESTLEPLLRRISRGGIDRVVISHRHRGHAGGLESVAGRLRPGTVFASEPGVGERCVAGQGWESAGVGFVFLHPSEGLPYLGGDSSCVLRIDSAGGRMLLPGGVDAAAAARLAGMGESIIADAWVLPKGGHRRANPASLVHAVDGKWALISVAAHDRRGLPHTETLRSLEGRDRRWTSTGACGALRLRLREGRGPEVRSMATLAPRFWRPKAGCP